ncbi:3,9-dihydroxypterocarpan 6A-monooxygenase [Ricinus communis]|uniref:Cytochrome P450, putative n=1 Tax=Ricinus communis TaxID=3988 RepID=B9T4M2_RICCO|nr:3,9-dihydroxypterocarpan 6A-monooxygenase [Ricinus communis]EEF29183.1 cytochrome P450, putative [Ricinus communis]|eukprot:XP_002533191.1 3,9-dihydroxypterocarpan 6A-monooxygenase [Ricinus communis]
MDTSFINTCCFLFISIIAALLVRPLTKIIINSVTTKSRRRSECHPPPGPPSLPFIGHLHLLSSRLPESLQNLASRYGPIMQIYMAGKPVVVVSDANTAKAMLKTYDADFASKYILGFGLSRFNIYDGDSFVNCQYGPYWRFLKKLSRTQLLAGKQLDRFSHIREQETLKLLKSLVERSQEGEPCDLGLELSNLANSIICKMALGKRCEQNPNLPSDIRKAIGAIMGYTAKLSFTQIFGPLKNFDLSGNGKRLISATWEYDRLMEQLFKDYEVNRTNDSGPDEGKDMIHILLETYRDPSAELKLTKNQIKSFFLEIFLAGADTTSATIQWAITELANNPRTLKKLRDEMDVSVGSNRLVQESDIPNLPYLQAIVKETLRKHPPGPLLRRECMIDTEINGYDLKAGTKIIINAYAIMKDPKTFNEPEKFIPERFLVDHQEMDFNGQDLNFIPFGSGRRACIGASHGLIVTNTTIASLIQCFDWKLKDGDRFDIKETSGYSGAMAIPLLVYPITRFDPFRA